MSYPQPARGLPGLLLTAASLFLVAASSPQCARTDDRPLAPLTLAQSDLPGVGNCIRRCVDESKTRRNDEQIRFREAIQDCPPGGDCRGREAAKHVAIMQDIALDERDCKNGCHHQGRGHGGQ